MVYRGEIGCLQSALSRIALGFQRLWYVMTFTLLPGFRHDVGHRCTTVLFKPRQSNAKRSMSDSFLISYISMSSVFLIFVGWNGSAGWNSLATCPNSDESP